MPGLFELTVLLVLTGALFGLGAVPRIARRLGRNWPRYQRGRQLLAKLLFWRRFW